MAHTYHFIASGEDVDTDAVNCIEIEAADFEEALSIYKRCFSNDTCINVDYLRYANTYPAITHYHVKHGIWHHAVAV